MGRQRYSLACCKTQAKRTTRFALKTGEPNRTTGEEHPRPTGPCATTPSHELHSLRSPRLLRPRKELCFKLKFGSSPPTYQKTRAFEAQSMHSGPRDINIV